MTLWEGRHCNMYKVLKADKDAYITNRVITMASSGSFRTSANVGSAGSLDLFKLYGATFSSSSLGFIPNLELSRILLHFDLQPLKDLVSNGKINTNHSSFNCSLKLFDVYGGQTTPTNFDISVFPLSKSFDEGAGRDVVYYSDYDACNYISSSFNDEWILKGCSQGGSAEQICDYITSSINIQNLSLESSQHFKTGEEDLTIDVTKIVSATLSGILPDSGFRISLKSFQEQDEYSYFVKRFASRTAFNESKRPRLIIRCNDSLQDDSKNIRFDEESTIFIRNYSHGELSNLLSQSNIPVVGQNCLLLKLLTSVSGNSSYNLTFTGSQHHDGLNYSTGIYSASFKVPQSNSLLYAELLNSGSVTFTPTWKSLDESITYLIGDSFKVFPPQRSNTAIDFKNYIVTTSGIQSLHRTDENIFVRVNIFDYTSPYVTLVKRSIEDTTLVVKKAHYQIRDVSTNEVVVPFDETYKSTLISSDYNSMYFILDSSNLTPERSYTIDVMLSIGETKKIFKSISNVFKISDTQVN